MAGLFGQKIRDFSQSQKGKDYFTALSRGENFGSAMGSANELMKQRGMLETAQSRQTAMDDLTKRYKEAQMAEMSRPATQTKEQAFNAAYQAEKDPARQKAMYDYHYGLTGRPQGMKTFDIGGVPHIVNPYTNMAMPITMGGQTPPGTAQQPPATPPQTVTPSMVAENVGDIEKAKAAAKLGGLTLTPAEKSVDSSFSSEYVDWKVKGGSGDADKQILQLQEVIQTLGSGQDVTGPVTGNVPDWMQNVINPEAINTRDLVEEVVQRNLRLILGAQFTENEGKRLIARAYNPKLDEKSNIPRVQRLLDQMVMAKQSKDSASDYYEQNGTLKGWQGKLYNSGDFINMDFDGETPNGGDNVVNWDELP